MPNLTIEEEQAESIDSGCVADFTLDRKWDQVSIFIFSLYC